MVELNRYLVEAEPPNRFPRTPFKATRWKDRIEALRKDGVEIRAILERLRPHGYGGSYSALYRYIVHLEERSPEGHCRVETLPGEEAQVDFGHAGLMTDWESIDRSG